jgi:hypothetical protein
VGGRRLRAKANERRVIVAGPGLTPSPGGTYSRAGEDNGGRGVVVVRRGSDEEERRRRSELRRLDWCLSQLEDAQEAGRALVGPDLARRLCGEAVALTADMPVRNAIRVVLSAQKSLLLPSAEECTALVRDVLDECGARQLTSRIRAAVGDVCLLLLEAHQRRAWVSLGYRTWQEYVRYELNLSRSRSYELLEHGRVVQALEAPAVCPEFRTSAPWPPCN